MGIIKYYQSGSKKREYIQKSIYSKREYKLYSLFLNVLLRSKKCFSQHIQ